MEVVQLVESRFVFWLSEKFLMTALRFNHRCWLGLIVAALFVSISPGTSSSARETSFHQEPVVIGGICAPACVKYVHHATLRRTCNGCNSCGQPPIVAILPVQDPNCCSRCLEIPVCLPSCCCDVPKCSASHGLLGRGKVTYTWCCGYKVVVVFRKNGEVLVHSYGRA